MKVRHPLAKIMTLFFTITFEYNKINHAGEEGGHFCAENLTSNCVALKQANKETESYKVRIKKNKRKMRRLLGI